MSRLSLLAGHPVEPFDCTSSTLFYSDYGASQYSLNLAGTSPLTLYDIYTDHSQMYRALMPSMETKLSGTPIGGMTGNGGLAAAFDGNLNKGWSTSARSPGAVSGYSVGSSVGLAVTPQTVTRFKATSPNNNGFTGNNQRTEWELLYSDTPDFTTATVIKNGITPPNLALVSPVITEVMFSNGTPHGYWWLSLYGNGVNAIYLDQLELFATLPCTARGLSCTNGVLTNTVPLTVTGNAGVVTAAAQSLEYLGTVLISETAGTLRFTKSYGLDRMVPIWNAKNRVNVTVVAGNNAGTVNGHFTYTPAAQDDYGFVPANNNPKICITAVNGLAQGSTNLEYTQSSFENAASAVTAYWNSIGVKLNDFSGPSLSPVGTWGMKNFDFTGVSRGNSTTAKATVEPYYGAIRAFALEGARGNVTAFYGEVNQRFSATFEY